jgi:hypothetical protein
MAKASTIIRSFNGGEWSPTVEGRVDLEKYPSSLRESLNGILTPQGAWVGRSGTALVSMAYREDAPSTLIPFTHSVDQSLMLEFSENRISFLDEDGVVGVVTVAATVTRNGGTLLFTFPGGLPPSIAAGVSMVPSNAPPSSNLNGQRLRVLSTAGNTATALTTYQVGEALVDGAQNGVLVTAAYSIASPYTAEEAKLLRYVAQLDEIRLLHPTKRPYVLQRYGALDWRISPIVFQDGPFLPANRTQTKLTPVRTGSIVAPAATEQSITTDGTANIIHISSPQSADAAHDAFKAFDGDINSWWASAPFQVGEIDVLFTAPVALTGYAITIPSVANNASYTAKDYAPATFTLYGSVIGDGTDNVALDQQIGYVLYDNYTSEFFPLNNSTPYKRYALVILACQRNGPIAPVIAELRLTTATSTVEFDASSANGINGGQGFLATDVNRLLSFKGSDGRWRSFLITQILSNLRVLTVPQGDALLNTTASAEWKLGYWSDTTGWPTCGTFFQDRLWYGGSKQYPNLLAGSAVGRYDTFSSIDAVGNVLDDNAFVGQLNARKVPAIQWISADQRGLLIGTSSGEWAVTGDTNGVITAKTALARSATARGCAGSEAVRIDAQVLYIQKSRKTIREYAYQFQTDGYRAPSMSLFAAHLGAQPFQQIEYAAEPNSIVWARRLDGSIKALTYNREEDVIGWHSHDFSGLSVESIAVKPSQDGTHDVLWLAGIRYVNGATRRVIERLTKAWDYDQQGDPASAYYLDSGLRYQGAPVTTLYGLPHLEGFTVYGLADGVPTGPMTVTGGGVTLPAAASTVAIGLGYDAFFRTARIEGGAADGTAQGKTKRMHNIGFRIWQSCAFLFGIEGAALVQAIDGNRQDLMGQPGPLYTGDTGPLSPDPMYEMTGSVTVKRDKSVPLPLNVLAIMPQFLTQDR